METLHPLPAPALPAPRHALVFVLLALSRLLGRLAARLAERRAELSPAEREVALLGGPEGRALAVFEGGRLVGVLHGIERL